PSARPSTRSRPPASTAPSSAYRRKAATRSCRAWTRAPRRCESELTARESSELALHRVDAGQIAPHVVVAVLLARRQGEAAARVDVARPVAAEMDHGREILFLLKGRAGHPLTRHRARDVSVEHRRRHLDRVARHDSCVEAIEPARMPIVPRA